MLEPELWKVRLYGNFELLGTSGEPVSLPTKRAESLIAILVASGKHGLMREELAEILWPGPSGPKRKANLRQCLSILRKALGSEFLDCHGQNCRISERVSIESDFEQKELRQSEIFMPAMTGDWVEAIRAEIEDPGAQPLRTSPIAGFFGMLKWLGDYDPAKMLEMMSASPEMVEGIAGPELRELLGKIPEVSSSPGWKQFFLGKCALGTNIKLADRYLRAAAFAAERAADKPLLIRTLTELVTSAILLNNLSEAQALSIRLSELASRKNGMASLAANNFGKALLLLHAGAQDQGFLCLARAQDETKDALEASVIQALRAFFFSSYGRISEAENLLAWPTRIAEETGHGFLAGLCELTKTNLKVFDDDLAVNTLHTISGRSNSLENPHFKIYVKESIAMRYLRAGDLPLAAIAATEVRKLRRTLCLAYTPWDEMRLATKP